MIVKIIFIIVRFLLNLRLVFGIIPPSFAFGYAVASRTGPAVGWPGS
jgi:hypothetical protein